MSQLNILSSLRHSTSVHADNVATSCGDAEMTYSEFSDRAHRAAQGLRNLGLQPGDRVAVLMLNCHRFLELYFAGPISRTILVPLNLRWGIREFQFAFQDARPKALVVDSGFAERAKPLIDSVRALGVQHIIYASDGPAPEGMTSYEALIERSVPMQEEEDVDENEIVGIFYTSGTTGNPKGVMLTHRNLVTNVYHGQILLPFTSDMVYLHSAPMFHLADAGMTYSMTWQGGTHAFVSHFDAQMVLQAVEQKQVTAAVWIPTMINALLHHPDVYSRDLSTLKQVMYGASPMPLQLLKKAMRVFRCEFVQGYGMTEAAPLVTGLTVKDHRRGLSGRETILKSAGRPLLGVEVRVVDEKDQDVPAGDVGEIIIRGPNIMLGYWNNPGETEERLKGGWYRSRDMGKFDRENYLILVDRKDDMIKTGGEQVYSTEVEAVLYEHPAILEAAVVGVPDEKWIMAVAAFVVTKPGALVGAEELVAFCRNRLTAYKVPKRIEFLPELPKSGAGKILKKELRGESPVPFPTIV